MPRLVSGRLKDAHGRPVGGAMVMVAAGTAPTPEIAVRSGEDGGFRLSLPDGRFRLEAHHPDFGRAAAEVDAASAEREVELRFGDR